MPISKSNENSKVTSRSIALSLLAGTMLTMPLAGQLNAQTHNLQPVAATQGMTGFAQVVEKARPAVVSVLVKKSAKGATNSQFNQWQGRSNSKQFEEFMERFGLPRNFAERFGMPKEFGERRFGGNNQMTPRTPSRGQGSGFFISKDGYIVTNNHVVNDADEIKVRMHDGDQLTAKLVGADPKTDLAVLKVEGKNFPTVSWGESKDVNAGDWVITVGNPFGLSGTTTAGIVSARGREVGSGLYDYIQIDAPINVGNSGGPAFNASGEVIGVNTAIFSPSGGNVGIGFAIPSDAAKNIVGELISNGSIERAWLGVMIQPVTEDIAESFGFDKTKGALIASVSEDSPAEQADFEPGDIILSVDGKEVEDVRDLVRMIAEMDPKSNATIEFWRGNKEMTKKVQLGEQKSQQMAAATLTQKSSAKLGLMLKNGKDGVVIAGVEPGSPAAEKGLENGDVIERVNGQDVKTAKDVRDAVTSANTDGKEYIRLLIKGQNGNRFVALKMKRA